MRSIALIVGLVASVTLAQQPQAAPNPKPQKVDFTEQGIGGERQVPLGEIYLPPPNPKFPSLIKVRMNFNDKLQESVHEM